MFKELVKAVPVPAAGVALGLVALGNLVAPVWEGLRLILALLSLAFAGLVIAKIILFPKAFRSDMQNPVVASTFATLFMAIMQLSSLATNLQVAAVSSAAFVVWCAAIAGHFALMIWFAKAHIARRVLKDVHATYFIAYVGIIVASLTSPAFGMQQLGIWLFWFGFACYAVLFVAVVVRYLKHEVAEPAKPTFCVFAAPASLSLAGYLAVTDQPNIAFVATLAVLAQVFFVVVLTQLPKFLRLPFYPSYAAMTFPFVITATALTRAIECLGAAGIGTPLALEALVATETVFASAMVLYVAARYVKMLSSKVVVSASSRAFADARSSR